MKKLGVILAMLLFAVVSYGQTNLTTESLKSTTDTYFDVVGSNNLSYIFVYGNEATDTLGASDTWTYSATILKDYSADLKYEARVALDSVSGGPGVQVDLQGKYSWNDSWTTLETATWAGTSSDTTIILDEATAYNHRFIQILLTADGTAQKVQVERVEVGLYD